MTLLGPARAAIVAALLVLPAAPAHGAMSPQTFSDPIGDNCKEYVGLGSRCGPDISRVVFSAPDDGNLHVLVSYASFPKSTDPAFPDQAPEFVELGIYPIVGKSADLLAVSDTYRVAQTAPGVWTLAAMSRGLEVVGTVTTASRDDGFELIVPLRTLGFPWSHKYAVNAGSYGEAIPSLPDLAPNSGLFTLAEEVPPAPVVAPAISGLRGIVAQQRGAAIAGAVVVSVPGDLTIEALVPGRRSKLASVGKVTKRRVSAGAVSFRLALPARVRRQYAGRRAKVTLRLTLTPTTGQAVRQTTRVTLTVPR